MTALKSKAFSLFAITLSVLLLDFSHNVAVMNQGDFARTIGFMLGAPIDVVPYDGYGHPAFLWPYLRDAHSPLLEHNAASVYFWGMSYIERLVTIHFDLFLGALAAKAIILICCYRIAIHYQVRESLAAWWRYVVFTLMALAFFYAHNIEFINSFYFEHAFVVGMAIFVGGVFEPNRTPRNVLIIAGLLLACASKPQFFYLPCMYLVILIVAERRQRRRPDWIAVAGLMAVQVISCLPLGMSSTTNLNRYHALYFGAYKLLSADQLRALGVREKDLECVGVDAWGWKMAGSRSTDISQGPKSCDQRFQFSARDLLRPYLKYPTLIFRLAAWALPDHFTVHYFQLGPGSRYIRPSNGVSFRSGWTLIHASDVREQIVTRLWWLFLLLAAAVVFLPGALSMNARAVLFFLVLAVPTQIVISILGEGVRDLSKHLAGAQLCLDFAVMFTLLRLGVYGGNIYTAWSSNRTLAMRAIEERAQNGRGVERTTRRISAFLCRVVARSGALCAPEDSIGSR